MKTTYLKDGKKFGFIINFLPSPYYIGVDCFEGNETNIVNSYVTGKNIDKNLLALYQRCGVLFRKQILLLSECDRINIPEIYNEIKQFNKGFNDGIYLTNEVNFIHNKLFLLDTPTKESKEKICEIILNALK